MECLLSQQKSKMFQETTSHIFLAAHRQGYGVTTLHIGHGWVGPHNLVIPCLCAAELSEDHIIILCICVLDKLASKNAGFFVPLENDLQQKPTLKIHQIHAREYHQMEIQEAFHSTSIYCIHQDSWKNKTKKLK